MLTDADVKKLTQKFATKEDLKRFATKEDLKKFATKEDLKKFATKEDLKKFATKIDLGRFQIETKLEFEKIREEMATKDDFRQVMTVLDKVLKEVLAMRQEQTFHVEDHRRINDRLENLEHTSSAP